MLGVQTLGDGEERLVARRGKVRGQGFGGLVQLGKMVPGLVDQLAHPVDRVDLRRILGPVAVAHVRRHRLAGAAQGLIGAVEAVDRIDHGRRALHGLAQLEPCHRR